jgi:SpoVK/Ycf46/Vps4 family AAA+-type ATPase
LLDFIIQRGELEALTLRLADRAKLRQMFLATRFPKLVKSLKEIEPPRNCQGVALPNTNTRYSIETVLVQLVEGVARSPDLYSNSHINFILMGDAGAGKTFYARVIASVLKNCGLLISEAPIDIISKPELVGEHLGESAPKTKARLIRDLQNVMFIDEAYTLTQLDTSKPRSEGAPPNWEQYGFEAIGEIINFLDKNKGNICVIAAGYERDMKGKFLKINEGMPRRFPFQILLPNYTPAELAALFCKFMREVFNVRNRVSDEAERLLIEVIQRDYARATPILFPNSAGDIENLANAATTAATGDQPLTREDMEAALDNYALNTRNASYKALLEAEEAEYEEEPYELVGGAAYFGHFSLE